MQGAELLWIHISLWEKQETQISYQENHQKIGYANV
jgi:hypothetical protein